MRRFLKPRNLFWLALPLLLWWSLHGIPLSGIWSALRQLSPWALLVLTLGNVVIFLLFSSRWWLILRSQGYRISYFALSIYRLAAFGITYFTPGTQFGGEPLQVYSLHDRHQVPGSVAMASVSLDKLLELFVNFSFLVAGIAITLNLGLFESAATAPVLFVAIGLLSLPAGYFIALRLGKSPITWSINLLFTRWSAQLYARWPALRGARQAIAGAEEQVSRFCRHRPGAIFLSLSFSFVIWSAMLMEYWLTLRFLGLRFDLLQTIVALTAARLAFMLPVPAGLGALEASQVLAMQALGVQPALGLSISLLIRARDITFGVVGLWLAGALSRSGSVKSLPAEVGIDILLLSKEEQS